MDNNLKNPSVGLDATVPVTNYAAAASQSLGHDYAAKNRPAYQIEDKVAHLSLQVNQIIIRPYLQQALDYLRVSKNDAEVAYNALSDEVAQEVKVIQTQVNDLTSRIAVAKDNIEKLQQKIRNKYNNATEEEISSGQLVLDHEYNSVATEYENTMRWSQELTKYRMRIETLVETQNILDKSVIARTSEIQIEIDNLDLLLHNFDSSNYADVFASKKGLKDGGFRSFTNKSEVMKGRSEELNKLIDSVVSRTYDDVASINRREEPMRELPQAFNPAQQYYVPNKNQLAQANMMPQQPQYQQNPSYQEYRGHANAPYMDDVAKNSGNDKVFVVRKSNPVTVNNQQLLDQVPVPQAIKVIK